MLININMDQLSGSSGLFLGEAHRDEDAAAITLHQKQNLIATTCFAQI